MQVWDESDMLCSERRIESIEEMREELARLRDLRRTDGELYVGLTRIIAGLHFVKESL
jgi:hypothetical protein